MIDIGLSKMALIGAVALIVIGPEKLPRVARTVGTLLGKAQRYVSDVKAEVNRSMELDELKKMKDNLQTAAQDIGQTVQGSLDEAGQALSDSTTADYPSFYNDLPAAPYSPPRKNWRLKRGATPLWYKQRNGVRRHVQSGAARVARFRPNRQP